MLSFLFPRSAARGVPTHYCHIPTDKPNHAEGNNHLGLARDRQWTGQLRNDGEDQGPGPVRHADADYPPVWAPPPRFAAVPRHPAVEKQDAGARRGERAEPVQGRGPAACWDGPNRDRSAQWDDEGWAVGLVATR